MCTKWRQRGLTLIELIVFILIVGVALAGVLTVLNVTTKSSADPLVRKQMLSIAEALMEEVQLQPFTWCDPRDSRADTAISNAVGATGCTATTTVEGSGPENVVGALSRKNTSYPFNNVSDYSTTTAGTISGSAQGLGSSTTAVESISGSALSPAPAGGKFYAATIGVTQAGLNGIAASEALLISVNVAYGGQTITLEGYRTRYAPNSTQ